MSDDPYKYFRIEAAELVEALTRGVLDLEKGALEAESLSKLLRFAHTLKGAARVVNQPRIAELSHTMEGLLAALRDNPVGVTAEQGRELLRLVDGISAKLSALGQPAEKLPAGTPGGKPAAAAAPHEGAKEGEERFETVRIDVADMDALLRTVSELRVQMTGLWRQAQGLQQAAWAAGGAAAGGVAAEQLEDSLKDLHRSVSAILDRSNRQMSALYEQATAMRLVPADSVFALLERTARDAADATAKQVVFQASGGDVRLEAHGLRLLRHALVHLVRNAVAHGVEGPARRIAAGKPPAGSVRIDVQRRGDRAIFICRDDGQGIDVERVRQVVLARKLVTSEEAARLTPAAVADLLFRGGITTTRSVSQLAGRGIGLDVVREAVVSLHGAITARTEPGRGTCVELSVPVRVESQEVLHLQVGGSAVSIPRQGVKQALRVQPADIASSPEGQSILVGDQALRFARLGRLLKASSGPGPSCLSALVLESPAGAAVVGVDRIAGTEKVVIRSLPEILCPSAMISGAFLDSQGNPQLVLSIEGLVEAILSGAAAASETPAAREPPLLVIDDSLTTRMLEQGILESAGYEVETASSGEEALERARRRRYSLFVVDVEMPGMDGFTFIQTARGEASLADIPCIVVTSRDSAEDRARGARLGAEAYIVKSAFDETLLLKTIRQLVGR